MNYSKSYWKELKDFSTIEESRISSKAQTLNGRSWNRYIADFIIDEFLDKMEKVDPLTLLDYSTALLLLNVGMFGTAILYIEKLPSPSDQLDEIRIWFIEAIRSADDVTIKENL
jgi:DUF917 family protein